MDDSVETIFRRLSACDNSTVYYLAPNADGGAHDFTEGATLYWESSPDWTPQQQFFIPKEDLRALALMFNKAVDIAEGKSK